MTTSEHIQPHHLQRQAVVYPRQSSPQQVLNHQESLRLQYALTERAHAFGWDASQVQVIDTDLGITGSTAAGRPGFQELVTRVNLGQVGIIFAYDVTRLVATAPIGINFLICAVTAVASLEIMRQFTTRPHPMVV